MRTVVGPGSEHGCFPNRQRQRGLVVLLLLSVLVGCCPRQNDSGVQEGGMPGPGEREDLKYRVAYAEPAEAIEALMAIARRPDTDGFDAFVTGYRREDVNRVAVLLILMDWIRRHPEARAFVLKGDRGDSRTARSLQWDARKLLLDKEAALPSLNTFGSNWRLSDPGYWSLFRLTAINCTGTYIDPRIAVQVASGGQFLGVVGKRVQYQPDKWNSMTAGDLMAEIEKATGRSVEFCGGMPDDFQKMPVDMDREDREHPIELTVMQMLRRLAELSVGHDYWTEFADREGLPKDPNRHHLSDYPLIIPLPKRFLFVMIDHQWQEKSHGPGVQDN